MIFKKSARKELRLLPIDIPIPAPKPLPEKKVADETPASQRTILKTPSEPKPAHQSKMQKAPKKRYPETRKVPATRPSRMKIRMPAQAIGASKIQHGAKYNPIF